MKLISRYKRLSFWNKFAFWGSFISILAFILAIILFIVDYQLNKFYDEKNLPARETLVSAIFESYKYLNYASEYVISPKNFSPNKTISNRQKFLLSKWHLEYVDFNLKKVEKIAIRNNVALDPKLISLVSLYLDNAKVLQKKLTFFSQLYDPEMKKWDFVSSGPFKIFYLIENIINQLKKNYPQIPIEKNLKSAEELDKIWKEADKNNERIYLDVSKYVGRKNRVPMVFDRNDLVKLNLKLGGITYVYDLNE